MGLAIDAGLAEAIATNLTEHAKYVDNFVRIDMEDSSLTQVTLDIEMCIRDSALDACLRKYIFENRAQVGISGFDTHAQSFDRSVLGKGENLLILDNGCSSARSAAVNP